MFHILQLQKCLVLVVSCVIAQFIDRMVTVEYLSLGIAMERKTESQLNVNRQVSLSLIGTKKQGVWRHGGNVVCVLRPSHSKQGHKLSSRRRCKQMTSDTHPLYWTLQYAQHFKVSCVHSSCSCTSSSSNIKAVVTVLMEGFCLCSIYLPFGSSNSRLSIGLDKFHDAVVFPSSNPDTRFSKSLALNVYHSVI